MTTLREALAEPPEVRRIMELAEGLCRSYEAMSIPTGQLWRSITQDQFVRARQTMREAVADLLRAALAAQPAQAQALTDEHVAAVVRSVQPNLDTKSKAWRELTDYCRYWLEADRAVERAHGIGGK